MSRLHLFEFEDLKWFPSFLRNYMTDFLQYISNNMELYEPVIPVLEKVINKSNTNQIIDLGSGGGGGLLWLNSQLKKNNPDLKILLTDFYPNIDAFEHTKKQSDNFEYLKTPVDARKVPKGLIGLRTQFLSLHHFKPNDAKKILQNAIDSKSNIAIFEAQERSIKSILFMFFSPISVLIYTPFIKPFKLGRILFTYIIPIVPIFIWWDGIISALRTYSVKEMEELIDDLKNKDDFHWEVGRINSKKVPLLYLLGTKKK